MPAPYPDDVPVLYPLPDAQHDRIVLKLIRRMGAHGLHDAWASWIAVQHFGAAFRQPLTLLRCFMRELALASHRPIHIASCCAPRMTRDEALMLEALALSASRPHRSRLYIRHVTDLGATARVWTVAAAFHNALANIGIRLEG